MTHEQITRFFNKQCSAKEAAEVAAYLQKHPEVLERYSGRQEWEESGIEGEEPEADWDNYWKTIIKKKRATVVVMRIKRTLAAACLAGLLIAGYVMYRPAAEESKIADNTPASTDVKEGQFETKLITNTSRKNMTITTEDNTVITLFPSSMVRYAVPFQQGRRDIYLEGQANFKVAKDKNRPFTVYGGGLSTTALGTEFTVNTKHHGGRVSVKLFEGKVVVKSDPADISGWKDVFLNAGQQMLFDKNKMLVSVEKMEGKPVKEKIKKAVEKIVDEKGKAIVFNNSALPQVMERLGAYYDKTILFDPKDLEHLNFTGTVAPTDSLDVVLKVIAQMNDLNILSENGQYKIEKKQPPIEE